MTDKVKRLTVREAAVKVLLKINKDGQSCSRILPEIAQRVAENERALLQELCFGVLRWQQKLEALSALLLDKPLRNKDRDVSLLILVGIYQLEYMTVPEHAVLQETVQVTNVLRKKWAKGLVNALLRRYLREKDELHGKLANDLKANLSHPEWMLDLFKKDWPKSWTEIAAAANNRPPMTLRVNRKQLSRDKYLAMLADKQMLAKPHEYAEDAIILENPVNVGMLPGFGEGLVSVQDAGAQLAAAILPLSQGAKILDACAAPGGKTCHLLEKGADLKLIALDSEAERCEKIHENLQRLKLQAVVECADAALPDTWWDGEQFDAILLDVPCSALGVIRRHPDIKVLRQADDLQSLVLEQMRILEAVWPLLAVGGSLLYATCSLARQENALQVERFVNSHDDVRSINIVADWGEEDVFGRQILTGQSEMDGFFYALLEKTG